MEKAVVIGAGVMGSALAIHLGNNGVEVNLWGTQWDTEILKSMESTGKHSKLGVDLPKNINLYYENELEEAFKDTKLVIIAVLSDGMGSTVELITPYLNKNHYILSATKGIDHDNLYTMSDVIKNALPESLIDKVAVIKLGGPIIAKELAQGKYAEGVLASKNAEAAKYARSLFKSPRFKVDISEDIIGVDLCAAFKNSYAISMGIIESMEEDSNNPKAALMARGTIEMGNIVEAYGGDRITAAGIAGVGDYYVTSQGGRNGIFGRHLGEGKTVEEALEAMEGLAVEGYAATLNGYKFLSKLEKEGKFNMEEDTPLFQEIYNIIYEEKSVKDAINSYWTS